MERQINSPAILKKIRDKFRYGLILLVIRDYVAKLGIEIIPFYWMKETIPDKVPTPLGADLNDYEFSFFGPEEIGAICKLPEREFMNEEHMP